MGELIEQRIGHAKQVQHQRYREAEEVFEDILKFGSYAFNKAHSTGYALIAFKTAYMKVHYPTEYMAALLTFEMGSTDKVVEHIDECKRMGIDVSPPDINTSENEFTVVPKKGDTPQIRFGLAAVKGVGEKAVRAILAAREEGGPLRSIFDFCERVNLTVVNRSAIEALIKCGAFDSTGAMRKALTLVLDDAISHGAAAAEDRRTGQLSLFGDSGLDQVEPRIPTDQWSEAEMLANEKATLGFYVTKHPLSAHEHVLSRYASACTTDLVHYSDGSEVTLGGMISKMRTVLTKSGRNAGSKMGIVTLEDLHGQVEVILFSKDLQQYQSELAPETLVFFKGQVDRRRREPSLRVSEVIPLEQADERLSAMVIIRLDGTGRSASVLEALVELITQHSGDRPVFLEVWTGGHMKVTIRARAGLRVRPTPAFRQAVDELLGPGHLEILPPVRLGRPTPPKPAQRPLPYQEQPKLLDRQRGSSTTAPAC